VSMSARGALPFLALSVVIGQMPSGEGTLSLLGHDAGSIARINILSSVPHSAEVVGGEMEIEPTLGTTSSWYPTRVWIVSTYQAKG
jgi:hypothetical protein